VRPRAAKVSWRWLFVVAALFVAFAGLAFLRVWPPFATVMSASMSPTINTGDMVVLQRLDRPARIGDIAVVNVPDEARTRYSYPPVVIHRIVRISADGTVTTKGDAREDPDPFTVPRRAIGAHVIARVPGGGRIAAFLTSPFGLLWLGGGALMLIGLPLLEQRRDGQRTVAGELRELRAERAAVDERCDALSQELARVTQAFTDHLAALPAQLEAAVAAAVATRPPAVAPAVTAEPPVRAVAKPPAPPIACAAAAGWAAAQLPFTPPVPPVACAAAAGWAAATLPFTPPVPPIARAAAAGWAAAQLPFTPPVPPVACAAAAGWAAATLPFDPPAVAAVPCSPVPPVALVAAVVPAARRVPKLFPAPPRIALAAAAAWARAELPFAADPLDQLELALFAGPRAALAADESQDQLAFALDVERAPRFVRPCDNQLAFALETPAAKPDQLVISTPPPGQRWDTPPPSIVVRRRSGGLVGRALSLLAA
jgi:signal peptidase I